jgi:hypothetical protein
MSTGGDQPEYEPHVHNSIIRTPKTQCLLITMKGKMLSAAVLILLFSLTAAVNPVSAETLSPDDFKLQSFSKTIDFFDYARAQASALNKTAPDSDKHAYLYQVYINQVGFQLFYSGLTNITDEHNALTMPVQSFMEHYKTPQGKDVLTSSSFIMLLAFNDTSASLFKDSPDKNDNLYASFTLGVNLTNILGDHNKPSLSTRVSIIPLTSSSDGLTWKWGMKYANLTAVWWRMFTDPSNPRFEPLPIAITTYQELTFTYTLVINSTDHTATVTANYVIGRMTNLWMVYWFSLIPVVAHYNSTGTYRPNGTKIADKTIYQFLNEQHIKMSIVQFQNSLLLEGTTKSTFNNQNVTDTQTDVSNGSNTTTSGNEDLFKADFGTKKQYQLFNYTADNSENSSAEYDAVTRTVPRAGFARNPLFALHVGLLKYVPMVVAHIDPQLYQKARDRIVNMTYADYFYITSYPIYSGYKIAHDPVYTAFVAVTAPTAPYGLMVAGCIAVVAAIGGVFIIRRRGSRPSIV